MTHEEKGTAMGGLQPIFERGFDGIGEMLSAVLNVAMLIEREGARGPALRTDVGARRPRERVQAPGR